jgi:hypothetical protein
MIKAALGAIQCLATSVRLRQHSSSSILARMSFFSKFQVSGTGLTIVSTLAPTLGIILPSWLRWGIFSIGVLMIDWPWIHALILEKKSLKHMWPQYLMAFSALSFLLGLVAFLQMNVNAPTGHVADSASGDNELDGTVKAVCSVGLAPAQAISDRRLYTIQIGDPRWMSANMLTATMWLPPGTQELNLDDNFPKLMARCSITNFWAI